jgi:GTP-binding protein
MDQLLDAVIAHLPASTASERPEGEVEQGADESPWSPL